MGTVIVPAIPANVGISHVSLAIAKRTCSVSRPRLGGLEEEPKEGNQEEVFPPAFQKIFSTDWLTNLITHVEKYRAPEYFQARMKTILIGLLTLGFALLANAQFSVQYNPQDGKWYSWYNGQWWQVQAPNNQGNTAQPQYKPQGVHGYYWYPGHYGPTGTWYPGLWLAY